MKKFIILATVLLITAATAAPLQKKRLAVLDFTPHNLPESAARALRTRFELALFRAGAFDLLERDKIDLIAREHRVNVKCSTAECAVRVGKLVSADYIATATVDKDRDYTVVLRVIDVSTGTIAHADSISYSAEVSSAHSLESLAYRASYRFSPEYLNPYAFKSYLAFGGGLISPGGGLSTIAGNGGIPEIAFGTENFLYRGSLIELNFLYCELPGVGHLRRSNLMPLRLTLGHSFHVYRGLYVVPLASGGMSRNRVYTDEVTVTGYEPVASLGASLRYRINGAWFVRAESSRLWVLEADSALHLDTHLLYVGMYL